MKWILFVLFATLLSGCGSQSLEVIAENESGQRLENVTVSGAGKSFVFGVIKDSGEAGYMTAHQLFGRTFPEQMSMGFLTTNGKSFSPDVDFSKASKPTKKLRLKIKPDMTVIAEYE